MFVKLYGTILDSSVWVSCDVPTKIVWITLLAMADQDGEVQASLPGLARRAGVSLEECEAALATLAAPDPHSRSPEYEGRRIEELDGGWVLLNYTKYREMRSKNAVRQQQYRDRKRVQRS